MTKTSRLLAVGAIAAAAFASAHANVVQGSLWLVAESVAKNATIAQAASLGAADVTFTVDTPINFASGTNYTIGEFLASGGATILSDPNSVLNTLMDAGGLGTYLYFTGQVTVSAGQQFTAGHDDGMQLDIGGTMVIDAPGPTAYSVTTETYNGPSGTFDFKMSYGECCGAPANFSIDLPLSSVPEPATVALVGLSLLGLGWSRRQAQA